MLFNDYRFLFLYLPAVLVVSLLLTRGRWRELFLIGASFAFYGFAGWTHALILALRILWLHLFSNMAASRIRRGQRLRHPARCRDLGAWPAWHWRCCCSSMAATPSSISASEPSAVRRLGIRKAGRLDYALAMLDPQPSRQPFAVFATVAVLAIDAQAIWRGRKPPVPFALLLVPTAAAVAILLLPPPGILGRYIAGLL